MSHGSRTGRSVLIVDDEADVADAYAMQLGGEYETRVAYGGEEALEMVSETTAVVLLDRRMPDIHGDDVLAELRDRGYDGAVVMVTAVDPDLDILEMEFDDYLCKPVDEETLLSTVDQHVGTAPESVDPRLEEFFGVLSKLIVLEEKHAATDLEDDEEFQRLERRAMELSEELRESVENFEELVETHRSITRGS